LRDRGFLLEEDQPGRDQVAIVSYGLWQRRFGGDNNIVGQNLILDGVSHTVVGVMPPDFQFPYSETQVWTPITSKDSETDKASHYLNVIARTKPGIDLSQVQADVASIAAQTQREHPDHYDQLNGWSASVVTAREELVGEHRLVLLILLGIVSLVLLIVCLNVASLFLAHAASRHHEIAVRRVVSICSW